MAESQETPRESTVDALLETVRELLRAEEARATGINGRGSGLAAFVALIVSVSGLVAQRDLTRDLAGWLKVTVVVMFVLALVILVAVVLVTILGVLLPTSYRQLAMSEVRRYPLLSSSSRRRSWSKDERCAA